MEFANHIKNPANGLFTGFMWQGQKDSNPRHAVLEEFSLAACKWRCYDGFAFDDGENTTKIRRFFENTIKFDFVSKLQAS